MTLESASVCRKSNVFGDSRIYPKMGAEGTQDPIQKLRSTLETVERTSGAPEDNPDLIALKQIVLDKVTELRALREKDPREKESQDRKEL